MKSKLIKPLVITALVIAVMVGAYFVLDALSKPETVTPSQTPAAYVFDHSDTRLSRIKVELKGKPTYEITVDTSQSLDSYVVVPAQPGFSYNQTSLGSVASYMKSVIAKNLIAQEPSEDQLSAYGLSDPQGRLTATYKDGSTETLLVGGLTLNGDAYYVKTEGADAVYTIYAAAGTALLTHERDMRMYLELLPTSDDTNDPNAHVQDIKLTRPDGTSIALHRLTEEEQEHSAYMASTFRLDADGSYNSNSDTIHDAFIGPACAITYYGVEEDNPKNLSKYGLDTPYRLELLDTDGDNHVILIGSEGENGRYIMVEGVNTVLLSNSDYSFLEVDKLDLLSMLFWIYNIDDVTKVEYDLKGERHTLLINSDSDNDVFEASLDNGEIVDENARRLFMRAMWITVAGEVTSDMTIGQPEYTIKMTMRDGTINVMELCPINGRQLAVRVNGAGQFYTNIKDIENLINAFKTNAEGGTIPMI